MTTRTELFTLITGASTGLGRELARECARLRMNLILVSLPNEGLAELSTQLSIRYQIDVNYYETDLTNRSDLEKLGNWIRTNFSVNTVINNAGIGGTQAFDNASTDYLDRLIQLNIRATSLLTRIMIPELKMHRRAYILNVSSMAAFSPLPYKTVYPASKAFIYHFTRGLKAELRHTSIRVSVVNPGPIATNADVMRRIQQQGFLGRLTLLPTPVIARIAIRHMMRGKAVIVPGFLNKVNRLLFQIIPSSIRLSMSSHIIQRELNRA